MVIFVGWKYCHRWREAGVEGVENLSRSRKALGLLGATGFPTEAIKRLNDALLKSSDSWLST